MYKVKFANIMEMLYIFWSDKIHVGILKKIHCDDAVVSNILMSLSPVLYSSTFIMVNVHSIMIA